MSATKSFPPELPVPINTPPETSASASSPNPPLRSPALPPPAPSPRQVVARSVPLRNRSAKRSHAGTVQAHTHATCPQFNRALAFPRLRTAKFGVRRETPLSLSAPHASPPQTTVASHKRKPRKNRRSGFINPNEAVSSEFWPAARRDEGAYPQRSVSEEQRSRRPKDAENDHSDLMKPLLGNDVRSL